MDVQTYRRPPRTILEAYKCLPEGTMAQLINGVIRMWPPLFEPQAVILNEIAPDLHFFVKNAHAGTTRMGLYDVYLDEMNVFQPDICYISKESMHLIKEDGLQGAPDLVIEILSPSTAKYDLKDKKDVYEQYGVKEYWIVDPADSSVTGYSLTNGTFTLILESIGKIESQLLGWSVEFLYETKKSGSFSNEVWPL
jgi:Uma2 family endonuclease